MTRLTWFLPMPVKDRKDFLAKVRMLKKLGVMWSCQIVFMPDKSPAGWGFRLHHPWSIMTFLAIACLLRSRPWLSKRCRIFVVCTHAAST